MPTSYLEVEEVIEIHAQMIDHFGGRPGFNGDQGRALVESAVQRPRHKAYYEDADVPTQAASLLFGLAKNHGFLDGNKRVAAMACYAFLRLNGWRLRTDNDTLASFIERCSEEDWTEAAVVAFVNQHVVRLDP